MTQVKARANDIAGQINFALMERAANEGMNFSRYLEKIDPSDGYGDGLDAFERQLQIANIKTRTYMGEGIYADRFDAFDKNDATRALGIEFLHRCWRNAVHGMAGKRAPYADSDGIVGGSMRPFVDAAQERYAQIQPAVPISELIAFTTPIDGDAYRAAYLEDDTDEVRMKRVAEGADIPGAKLTASEKTVRLVKYGRALTMTYERLRRMRIDQVAFHIARLAVQAETDKVAQIIDVAVSGDGNAGTTAPVHELTDLDTGTTANNLTVKAWLAFKMKFTNPYAITTALTQEGPALALQLLNMGSANIPLVSLEGPAGFGGLTPINPELRDNVRLGWLSDAPSGKIVGIDRRFAIERVTEIGSNISETQRFITNQTQVLTLTETEGYAKLDNAAVRVLDLTQ